jgi:hypothetical protein
MADILNQIVSSESSLVKLLGNYEQSFVGYVYAMKFDEVFVLTNDKWKHDVGGIPHNSFLVAAGFNPARPTDAAKIDQEVVLLRVLEPASLPQAGEFIKTCIEHHQRRTADEKMPGDVNDGLDPLTASELQAGGLRCSVLGTFYVQDGRLRLGSDIENFMTLSRLRAYKPSGDALELIVNHVNPETRAKADEEAKKAGFLKSPSPIEIGTVRFTSTDRMHRSGTEPKVKVFVQPADFLARRTAILGMTRTGKSNTVKTTVSAVALAALKDGVKVGQLIFDVNGEYANANHQDDGSSIAEVFPGSTKRYRAIETDGFEDLRTNFYLECESALNLIQALFRAEKTSSFSGQDLEAFMSTTLEEPDASAKSEHTRWERHRAVFQCILYRAGYAGPSGLKISVPIGASLIKQMKAWAAAKSPAVALQIPAFSQVPVAEAASWFEQVRATNNALRKDQKAAGTTLVGLESSTKGNPWVDPVLEAMLNILVRETSRDLPFGGWRAVQKYRPYHSSRRSNDVTGEIIAHLDEGRIVILDLSAGPVEIREVLSKRIAGSIFERQMSTMHEGRTPQNVVLYVEEAHNLIGKKEELQSTWPRIAKEGAKARIAFVYATQEPSSVHPNILANTENWFVTHLNNDDEIKTLSKFYDFGDFAASLKSAQDVGFARIKSLSSPFVVPTQIKRFTPSELKAQIAAIGKQ